MTDPCRWCGQIHETYCPLVKAYEFREDGVTIKRVEFLTSLDYPQVKAEEPEQDYPKLVPKG